MWRVLQPGGLTVPYWVEGTIPMALNQEVSRSRRTWVVPVISIPRPRPRRADRDRRECAAGHLDRVPPLEGES